MTTRKKSKKPQRLVRSEEYKKEAVKLAETVGVTNAAKQLACFIHEDRGSLNMMPC